MLLLMSMKLGLVITIISNTKFTERNKKMDIIDIIKNYWVLITTGIGVISALFVFCISIINGVKCSLRNDILDIFDRCKDNKQITHYQLQATEQSYILYKKLKGNSFVDDVMGRIKDFELID